MIGERNAIKWLFFSDEWIIPPSMLSVVSDSYDIDSYIPDIWRLETGQEVDIIVSRDNYKRPPLDYTKWRFQTL